MKYRVPLTLCVAPVIEFSATVVVEAANPEEAVRLAMEQAPHTEDPRKWHRKPGQARSWGPGGKGITDEYFDERSLDEWASAQSST